MSSSVEGEDILTDLASTVEQDDDLFRHLRLEKDSSNDGDAYEDTSDEENHGGNESNHDGITATEPSDNSKTNDCRVMVAIPKETLSDSEDTIALSEPSVSDEQNLLLMTKEENQFDEAFKESNPAQLTNLKCTTCSCQLFLMSPENIRFHPVLGVLVCRSCRLFYSKGPFTKDEDGHDEYCRWCAEGGTIICCDTCSNVFCKACLRRCMGRATLLEISTNSGCKWSCLVCNNLPIWSQRSLSRMVLHALQASRRKSISVRSGCDSPAALDSNDPAVWVPAIINEAEKLASYCKMLATKVSNVWLKEGGEGSSSGRTSKQIDQSKVTRCCRKLRKVVVNTKFNMNMLEKKIVTKYTQKYGNASDIEVDNSCSSATNESSSPQIGKRLVLKIKNFREDRSDFYAEIRASPAAESSKRSSPKSINSAATIPQPRTPLQSRRILSSDDEDSPVKSLPEDEKPKANCFSEDDTEQFFDPCPDVTENKSASDNQESAVNENFDTETVLEDNFELHFSGTIDDLKKDPLSFSNPSSRAETPLDSGKSVRQNGSRSSTDITSPINTENTAGEISVAKLWDTSPSEQKQSTPKVASNSGKQRKPSSKLDSKPVVVKTEDVEMEDVNRSEHAEDLKASKPEPKQDANEKARQALLNDSSSDSDDSLADITLSPRVKHTQKRNRSTLGLDDPKLKAECAVVVKRILDLEEAANAENGTSDELALQKKVDRLIKETVKPLKKAAITDSSSDTDAENPTDAKIPKAKKAKPAKKTFRLSDLNSSSDSEGDHSPKQDEAAKSTAAPVVLDQNEAARQRLLASSDSESEADTVGVPESEEEIEEAKDEMHGDDLPIIEDEDVVEEVVETINDDENEICDEAGETNASRLKPNKLLQVPLTEGDATESKTAKEGKGEKAEKRKRTKDAKKRRIHSDSDFESSGSEDVKKKRKAKKQSSGSNDEDADSQDEGESKRKRRRRIKKVNDSDSEEQDSDIEVLNESQRSDQGGSKGRKNIKKIIKDQNLKDETKAAAREEENRKKRIAERQKFYNAAFTSDELVNARTDHLVLDFDPKTKEPLVTVDEELVKKLKPHQVKGVKFMWDACFESVERIKEHPGSGCILAHCMGLGKSLQVVTLAHTVLTHEAAQVTRVLVVCPLSTVLNWLNEFKIWLPQSSDIEVYELTNVKTNELRMYTLRNWYEGGGVMILGYDMYRNLTNENGKRVKGKARDVFQRSLVDPGPQLVICDEGHLLKNEATAVSKAMNRISTRRRIVLTGTPLQNSLIEYHCMIQFVKPNLLGTKKEFTNRFANPIKNGQAADSTDGDVRVMKRRAHVLHKMLEDSVQRFDYAVLTPFLPPKHEYVISVKMSELQIKMYQYYLDHHAKGGPAQMGKGKGTGLFADFQELGRVWTHPRALRLAAIRRDLKAIGQSDSEGSIAEFLDDRETPSSEEDRGVVCLDESDDENDEEDAGRRPNGWRNRTRAGRGDQPPPEDELGVTAPLNGSWWSQFVTDEDMEKIEHSGKLVLLLDILRQCELIGDKVLVFSQSLVSLSLIEEFLAVEDQRNEENRVNLSKELKQDKMDSVGTWRLNADYFRLDGQTSPELRKNWCNAFNNPTNLRSRLFLISTKAGGLGINLVAANRVIIFDASWNPSHDVQSIFRIYRFGQKKPCYVYRFLAQGTMEEKIYDRQVTKLSLSCRVVDEQQIERHFNSADLSELYLFEPDSHLRRPTPLLPKDRLLAELTIQRKEWIVTYHEHDSLLENKSEEELNEAERKAAWDDFENEKRGISTNVGMGGLMFHEQPGFMGVPGMPEILATLAGRQVAGIPLSNIAAMIYNSNPGITQEEFLGRLKLTVEQLQAFSVQQAAVAAATAAANAASASQASLQQPGDAQRLLMQRQVAADQLKRQFGPPLPGQPGPSGVGTPPTSSVPPRSRGRPTIGPHQRTDLYGLAPVIYNGQGTPPPGSSGSSTPK